MFYDYGLYLFKNDDLYFETGLSKPATYYYKPFFIVKMVGGNIGGEEIIECL